MDVDQNSLLHGRVQNLNVMLKAEKPSTSNTYTSHMFLKFSGGQDFMLDDFHQASTRTACCSCRNSLCSIPRCHRDKPDPHTCSASQQPVPYKCTDSTRCAWARTTIWMQHLYHVKARNARVSACHRQDFRTQDHTISNKS